MKQQNRIRTLHPAGKQGVNIERATYDAMRGALLKVIPAHAEGVAFSELKSLVGPHLLGSEFPAEASVSWYVTVVKQDLEARGELEQVAGMRPQRLRVTS